MCGVCVCVCVCVWCGVVSLAALRFRYPVNAGLVVVSVFDTHEAENLGRNWYNFLTAGLNSYVPSGDKFLQNAGNSQSAEKLSQFCSVTKIIVSTYQIGETDQNCL